MKRIAPVVASVLFAASINASVHAETLQEVTATSAGRLAYDLDAISYHDDTGTVIAVGYWYSTAGGRRRVMYGVTLTECAKPAGTLYYSEDAGATLYRYLWTARGDTVADRAGVALCAAFVNTHGGGALL